MGLALAVIGSAFFLTGALLYGGVLRSCYSHPAHETTASYVLAAVGVVVMAVSVAPIPGVTL